MRPLALAAVLLLVGAAGCAREDGEGELPAACTSSDADSFVAALAAAPQPVRVDGTAISDCLPGDVSVGDLQAVGQLLIDTAQRLRREDRPLPLGYLVGAVRRGADPGVHSELVRRVEQAAAPFERSAAFARGERAGRTSG